MHLIKVMELDPSCNQMLLLPLRVFPLAQFPMISSVQAKELPVSLWLTRLIPNSMPLNATTLKQPNHHRLVFDYNTKLYFESVCVGMSGLCCICVFCALKSPWRLSFWLGDLVWAGFDLAAADMPLLSTGQFKNTVCSNCSRGSKWQDLQCMILVCSENN